MHAQNYKHFTFIQIKLKNFKQRFEKINPENLPPPQKKKTPPTVTIEIIGKRKVCSNEDTEGFTTICLGKDEFFE